MKHTQASFLFFFAGVLSLPLLCMGQTVTDSSTYYYEAVLHSKNPTDLPEAIGYYTKKKKEALLDQDTLRAIEALRLIAIGQFKIGNYYDSEETATEAINFLQHLEQTEAVGNAQIGLYNQLGNVYRNLENYEAALAIYHKALPLATHTRDSSIILNNIANVYKDQKQYANALTQYNLIASLHARDPDSLDLARVVDNMGAVLTQMKDPSALDSLRKACRIRTKKNDLNGLYSSYKNLALYYHTQGDYANAADYAKKARETAIRINSPAFRYDALALLAHLNANPDMNEYSRLTDSLTRARQLAENKNAFIKYNLEEERHKTALQELQKEKERRSKQLFQLSTGFILIILILSYFIFRYRYKKGKQQEMYRTEQRIAKKVHDELANDIFNVMAFAESKELNKEADKEYLLKNLDRLYGKSRDISRDNAPIETGATFPDTLHALLSNFGTDKVNVLIKGLRTIAWKQLDEYKKIACYRVLQELMTNMKKHSQATLVLLEFRQEQDTIRISYTDNGVGLVKDASIRLSGLRNAENRIVANKGNFTFETRVNKGFHCTFSFPV